MVLFTLVQYPLFAQSDFGLLLMKQIPQSHLVNPALKPKANFHISLLPYQQMAIGHNGFSIRQLMVTGYNDDTLRISPINAYNAMRSKNDFYLGGRHEVLNFGFKSAKSYLNFNISARWDALLTYPKDIFTLAIKGNASEHLGKRLDIGGFRLNANAYMEYALGIQRSFNKRLDLGVRAKVLSGIANIRTKESRLGLYTHPETYDLTFDGAYSIQTSGFHNLNDPNQSFDPQPLLNRIFDFKNFGLAIDAGANYQMNKKLSLQASILDFGFIRWRAGVHNYKTNQLNVTFKGIDLERFLNDTSNGFENTMDSLRNLLFVNTSYKPYITSLYSRILIGGRYDLSKNISISGNLFGQIHGRRLTTAINAGANLQLRNWLALCAHASYTRRAINNVGMGFMLKGGPIQFYANAENLLGFFMLEQARYLSFSTGLNLVIGTKVKSKQQE